LINLPFPCRYLDIGEIYKTSEVGRGSILKYTIDKEEEYGKEEKETRNKNGASVQRMEESHVIGKIWNYSQRGKRNVRRRIGGEGTHFCGNEVRRSVCVNPVNL
jgi:hypothetical protein